MARAKAAAEEKCSRVRRRSSSSSNSTNGDKNNNSRKVLSVKSAGAAGELCSSRLLFASAGAPSVRLQQKHRTSLIPRNSNNNTWSAGTRNSKNSRHLNRTTTIVQRRGQSSRKSSSSSNRAFRVASAAESRGEPLHAADKIVNCQESNIGKSSCNKSRTKSITCTSEKQKSSVNQRATAVCAAHKLEVTPVAPTSDKKTTKPRDINARKATVDRKSTAEGVVQTRGRAGVAVGDTLAAAASAESVAGASIKSESREKRRARNSKRCFEVHLTEKKQLQTDRVDQGESLPATTRGRKRQRHAGVAVVSPKQQEEVVEVERADAEKELFTERERELDVIPKEAELVEEGGDICLLLPHCPAEEAAALSQKGAAVCENHFAGFSSVAAAAAAPGSTMMTSQNQNGTATEKKLGAGGLRRVGFAHLRTFDKTNRAFRLSAEEEAALRRLAEEQREQLFIDKQRHRLLQQWVEPAVSNFSGFLFSMSSPAAEDVKQTPPVTESVSTVVVDSSAKTQGSPPEPSAATERKPLTNILTVSADAVVVSGGGPRRQIRRVSIPARSFTPREALRRGEQPQCLRFVSKPLQRTLEEESGTYHLPEKLTETAKFVTGKILDEKEKLVVSLPSKELAEPASSVKFETKQLQQISSLQQQQLVKKKLFQFLHQLDQVRVQWGTWTAGALNSASLHKQGQHMHAFLSTATPKSPNTIQQHSSETTKSGDEIPRNICTASGADFAKRATQVEVKAHASEPLTAAVVHATAHAVDGGCCWGADDFFRSRHDDDEERLRRNKQEQSSLYWKMVLSCKPPDMSLGEFLVWCQRPLGMSVKEYLSTLAATAAKQNKDEAAAEKAATFITLEKSAANTTPLCDINSNKSPKTHNEKKNSHLSYFSTTAGDACCCASTTATTTDVVKEVLSNWAAANMAAFENLLLLNSQFCMHMKQKMKRKHKLQRQQAIYNKLCTTMRENVARLLPRQLRLIRAGFFFLHAQNALQHGRILNLLSWTPPRPKSLLLFYGERTSLCPHNSNWLAGIDKKAQSPTEEEPPSQKKTNSPPFTTMDKEEDEENLATTAQSLLPPHSTQEKSISSVDDDAAAATTALSSSSFLACASSSSIITSKKSLNDHPCFRPTTVTMKTMTFCRPLGLISASYDQPQYKKNCHFLRSSPLEPPHIKTSLSDCFDGVYSCFLNGVCGCLNGVCGCLNGVCWWSLFCCGGKKGSSHAVWCSDSSSSSFNTQFHKNNIPSNICTSSTIETTTNYNDKKSCISQNGDSNNATTAVVGGDSTSMNTNSSRRNSCCNSRNHINNCSYNSSSSSSHRAIFTNATTVLPGGSGNSSSNSSSSIHSSSSDSIRSSDSASSNNSTTAAIGGGNNTTSSSISHTVIFNNATTVLPCGNGNSSSSSSSIIRSRNSGSICSSDSASSNNANTVEDGNVAACSKNSSGKNNSSGGFDTATIHAVIKDGGGGDAAVAGSKSIRSSSTISSSTDTSNSSSSSGNKSSTYRSRASFFNNVTTDTVGGGSNSIRSNSSSRSISSSSGRNKNSSSGSSKNATTAAAADGGGESRSICSSSNISSSSGIRNSSSSGSFDNAVVGGENNGGGGDSSSIGNCDNRIDSHCGSFDRPVGGENGGENGGSRSSGSCGKSISSSGISKGATGNGGGGGDASSNFFCSSRSGSFITTSSRSSGNSSSISSRNGSSDSVVAGGGGDDDGGDSRSSGSSSSSDSCGRFEGAAGSENGSRSSSGSIRNSTRSAHTKSGGGGVRVTSRCCSSSSSSGCGASSCRSSESSRFRNSKNSRRGSSGDGDVWSSSINSRRDDDGGSRRRLEREFAEKKKQRFRLNHHSERRGTLGSNNSKCALFLQQPQRLMKMIRQRGLLAAEYCADRAEFLRRVSPLLRRQISMPNCSSSSSSGPFRLDQKKKTDFVSCHYEYYYNNYNNNY